MRIVRVQAMSPSGAIIEALPARPGQLQDRLSVEVPHDNSARTIVCDRSLPDITDSSGEGLPCPIISVPFDWALILEWAE